VAADSPHVDINNPHTVTCTASNPSIGSCSFNFHHSLRSLYFLEAVMDDRPHKAHRPAQSGAKADKKAKEKGKEKQNGFNEKVSL